jgi:cytochrome c oxidase subunit 4
MHVGALEFVWLSVSTAYWIAFGPHGPRAEPPPGENWKIVRYTVYGLLVSAAVFYGTHHFARPPPKTMSEEWQKATNEYARVS